MRVLVVSDSHGSNVFLNRALEEAGEIDFFMHLGDLEGSEHFIETFVDCPTALISGNNDYFSQLDHELEFELEGHHIFMTHGHRYNIYAGVDRLREEGEARGADIVLFGHTHCPYIEETDDMVLINPGSISRPRQEGRIPTYVILDLFENGEVNVELFHIKNNDEKPVK